MTLAEVGRAGQHIDLLDGGDVAPDGRLLSVQEIQERLRRARVRGTTAARPASSCIAERTDDIDTVLTKPASAAANPASAVTPRKTALSPELRLNGAPKAN